ncbi:protein ACCELERATED CELL DEATH 6-like [Carya illinoinensis]|uniref:protein ACCELERATED CELL DEATH 6-like n=1 Tax=Carya illinoinensis TaxID=32201 RepID=UPI001C7210BE|nr:protein ACCELERATED CELL DEATH 6-like [Carya illinoinensis]
MQLVIITVPSVQIRPSLPWMLFSIKPRRKATLSTSKIYIHDPLDRFLTVNKNTILHIFISSIHVGRKENSLLFKIRSSIFGLQDSDEKRTDPASAAEFVRYVLEKCPSLSLKANEEEETALHIAARYGHVSIVEVLINQEKSQNQDDDLESGVVVGDAKEMPIGRVNKKNDTALHEAVRSNHIEVVKLLIKKDPDFSYGANAAGETPLYLATERNFSDLASEILETLKSPAYDGPHGRTVLHAAAFYDNEGICFFSFFFFSINLAYVTMHKVQSISLEYDFVKNFKQYQIHKIKIEFLFSIILGINLPSFSYGALSKQADHKKGWTPLQVAAYMNNIKTTQLLLEHDRELAYIKDVDGRSALHIAAQRNSKRVGEEIVSMCPDCCELVDQTNRNELHDLPAQGHLRKKTVEMILKNLSSLWSLFNDQKDADGNTPLHIHCKAFGYDQGRMNSPGVDKRVSNENSQLDTNQIASTRENLPTHELGQNTSTQKKEENLVEFDKVYQAHLAVAALIATVTFAAGISFPGGFVGVGDNQPPGSAVLWNTKGLADFLFYDIISFVLSTVTVIFYLIPYSNLVDYTCSKLRKRIPEVAFLFSPVLSFLLSLSLYVATVSMMAAFVTAITVAAPDSKLRLPAEGAMRRMKWLLAFLT